MKVLLTVATGFVGRELLETLLKSGVTVVVAVRNKLVTFPDKVLVAYFNDMFELKDPTVMEGVDTIIHCAGKVHVIHENDKELLDEYRKVNTKGTLNLANQAVKLGVKRFVFMSSIGVLGNKTTKPFSEISVPNPHGAYALSKYDAEKGLQSISEKTDLEVVIIRPPLVYGPNAPGNFARLLFWLDKNFPLPLGSINNKRSFLALDNLVDFIMVCSSHPKAANQVFLVSDDEDLSLTDFLNRIYQALGKKSRLIRINQKILRVSLIILGKKELAKKLLCSLQVDISKAKNILNWQPVLNIDKELEKIALHHFESKHK